MTPREPEDDDDDDDRGGRKFYGEVQVHVLMHGPKACKVTIGSSRYQYWIPWTTIENNGEKFPAGYKGRMYVETWKLQQLGVPWK